MPLILDFISNKVIFTNEPCAELTEEALFLPIENNTGQYKQCGPAGYYWIFPCSPGTVFIKSRRACVRQAENGYFLSAETTTPKFEPSTNSTTKIFHVNNINYPNYETSQLSLSSVNVTTSQSNVNVTMSQSTTSIPLKYLYDVIIYFPETVFVESNLSSINRSSFNVQTTTPQDYYDTYDESSPALQIISTTSSYVDATKDPKYYTSPYSGPADLGNYIDANPNENRIMVNLLNSQKYTESPDPDIVRPDNPDYYKYHIPSIRRTPATYEFPRADNLLIGTTVKSQEPSQNIYNNQPGNSQWQNSNSNSISHNAIVDPHQNSNNEPDPNWRNQKPPPFYAGGHNAKPQNAPLSQGAQELAKIISEEDLETLSRVFGMLASQQGPVPGSNPPQGPIMMPTGFAPPVPEASGGGPSPPQFIPQGPVPNQLPHFYNMIPPSMFQPVRVTEPPRQFHIVPECVENGTCSHDDMAETYCMHETDPVSYYQCSPGVDYGIWVIRQCPAGLHFNSEGECGKKRPGVNSPSPPATRPPIPSEVQSSGSKIPTGSNENLHVWPPQPYEPAHPEPSYATKPVNPYAGVLMQTITPESSFISENNLYPDNSGSSRMVGNNYRGSNEQNVPQANVQLPPRNQPFVKQPPQTWDKGQPRGSSQENRGVSGTSVLFPGIQQTVNQLPAGQTKQVVGPRIPPNAVKPQPVVNVVPQIQPRPATFPQNSGPSQPKPSSATVGETDLYQGKIFEQTSQLNLPQGATAPRIPRPSAPAPPQPAPSIPKSSNEVNKHLAIGEQLIQQPHFPPELQPVFQNLIPNSGPPGSTSSSETNGGRPKQPPINTIQQIGSFYGGYPRYPEIPQLKTMTESAWIGSGNGNVQQSPVVQAAINGQQLQTSYSLPMRPRAMTQTLIRPKQMQTMQNLINGVQLRNPGGVASSNLWPVNHQLLKDAQRDSPISEQLSFRTQHNVVGNAAQENSQNSADLLFTDLMSSKVKAIGKFIQALAEVKSQQENFVSQKRYQPSSPLFPFGLNYVKSNDNNGYRLFVAGKTNNFSHFPVSSSFRSKSLHKTQERDNANFTVPFWPINGTFGQPFVGQKCSLFSTTKAVKFNLNTYLSCIPRKTLNNDTSTGHWVLMTCPESQMFDRLLKKCTENLLNS